MSIPTMLTSNTYDVNLQSTDIKGGIHYQSPKCLIVEPYLIDALFTIDQHVGLLSILLLLSSLGDSTTSCKMEALQSENFSSSWNMTCVRHFSYFPRFSITVLSTWHLAKREKNNRLLPELKKSAKMCKNC